MKVVLFGGSGFLGSHVADALTADGHDVTIFDIKESPYLTGSQKMIVGDIMDESQVREALEGAAAVYNFAGIADLDEASRNPVETVRYNVLGNTIVLNQCVDAGIKRFMYASTLYVYSSKGSFYRSSKQSSELIIEDFADSHGLDYTIMRYGSLYGPRSDNRNWIHRIINDALTTGKIVRHGDGEELREYIHVKDAARLSVEVLADDYINQNIIITGYQQMRIKDLVMMIREMLDNKISIEFLNSVSSDHYEITPYNFTPKVGRKIICKDYHDLGQGILECISTAYKEKSDPQNTPKQNGR
jgi:UDP-glucose 4-epimerase